jgi:acetylornithine deacetylase/succinyl-diaminopimelate desuccinylase family protein
MESIKKAIIEKIEEMREEIIYFHKEIVQIPSENPPGKYKQIAQFVQNKFEELGLKTFVKRNNVVGKYQNLTGPSLLLYGHMDTVPAYKGWTEDPFGGHIIDGKIFGRGACDDKACVTAEIFATKALLELGIKFEGSLTLISAIDEETGGFNGVRYLLDKGHINGDACLLGDGRGGFPAAFTGGFIMVTFMITGKKAHALSFPDIPKYRNEFSGVNAIQKMVNVLNFLMQLQAEFLNKETKYPNFPGHPSKVSTVNIAKIIGGDKLSAVPDKCLLYCIINTIPEQDVESIKQNILEFVEKSRLSDPELDINVNFSISFEPFVSNTNSKFAKAIKNAIKIVYNEDREFKLFQSANDGHWFHEKGIETIIMGTGSHENNVHAEDEFVSIDDLIDTTKIFALTAFNYLRSKD